MTTTRHPVIGLALAEIASLAGTRLAMIAIPWLVLTTTGDPLLTGVVAFAEMLPYVVVKALGGPLIDRLGPRAISMAGDLASMAVVALIPLLHLAGVLDFAVLLPIAILLGATRGPTDSAKQAMVPDIARASGLPLERITGLIGGIERFATVIGAAAAGALVALVGAAEALALTSVTCGIAALIVAIGLRGIGAPVTRDDRQPASYFGELREGWVAFRTAPVLVGIVVMIAGTNLLDQAYGSVLLPVWVNATADATLLGLLISVFAAASVAGAALAAFIGERMPRLAVYTVAFIFTGAPRFLVFAFHAPLAALIVVLMTAGFASGFLNPIISAVMFERIPAALTGRVVALVNALCWVLMPFGGLFGGALIALIGLPATFALAGLLYFAVTMLPLALPGFRAFGRRPAAPPAGTPV